MRWKTLAGRCIYNSPTVKVLQNPIFRWLEFDSNFVQTIINRRYPHKAGASYIKPFILPLQLAPGSCCMLGLGGAGVAHALSPFLANHPLTIVEKNSEVITLSQQFFRLSELKNINLIHQDANLFVQEDQNQYQHLLIDLFTESSFPTSCKSELFFLHCKRLLKPNGILAINLANVAEQWQIGQMIRTLFINSTLVIPSNKLANMIIYAVNNQSILPLINTLQKSRKIKRVNWDPHWGWLAML